MQIAAGETLHGALVTVTETDGNYPNHACQSWNIISEENQVYSWFQIKSPVLCFNVVVTKLNMLDFTV